MTTLLIASVVLLWAGAWTDIPSAQLDPGASCTAAGCHDAFASQRSVHPALQMAGCEACHDQRDEAHDFEPVDASDENCLVCHDDGDDMQWVHAEGAAGCVDCHDPHASQHRRLLHEAPQQLCLVCHDTATDPEVPAVHRPARQGRCLSCHHPHRVQAGPYLRAAPPDLCVKCHRNMAARAGSRPGAHLLLADRSCLSCHHPHEAEQRKLLREAYAPGNYLTEPAREVALCFGCHASGDLFEGSRTAFVSDDGRNLHALHAARNPKARSCRTCHTMHAHGLHRLVGEGFRMGTWKAPLAYERTAERATCYAPCHAPRGYPILGDSIPQPSSEDPRLD
ncbi:MAG: cytochrome c3 family protein [Candidatus Krumholzibacteriia bacterium]